MKRYFVIETATETVTNTILWDGVSDYTVGEGFELVEVTDETMAYYFPEVTNA
jgi:hypothetical protein